MFDDDDEEDGEYSPRWNKGSNRGEYDRPFRSEAPRIGRRHDDEEVEIDDFMPGSIVVDEYNPFRYSYNMRIPSLNMEVTVKFLLDRLNPHAAFGAVDFTDKTTGIAYRFPFFPSDSEGDDPGDTYLGYIDDFYRGGEAQLVMIPTIERAKVFGDGLEKGDVLITREQTQEVVTPELLMQAICDFYAEVRTDRACPRGLALLLSDMTKSFYSPWDSRSVARGGYSGDYNGDEADLARRTKKFMEELPDQELIAAITAFRDQNPSAAPFDIKRHFEADGWINFDLRKTHIRAACGMPPMNIKRNED